MGLKRREVRSFEIEHVHGLWHKQLLLAILDERGRLHRRRDARRQSARVSLPGDLVWVSVRLRQAGQG